MAKRPERWLPIVGYESSFEISNNGRVRTIARYVKRIKKPHFKDSIIKKQRVTKFGYHTVMLSINKKYRHFMVHRLVACAFICPAPTPKHHVNHKNGIKSDNRVENLEWTTPSENLKHAYRTGLMTQKGEAHATVKLNNKKVLEIYNSNLSDTKLAEKYEISRSMIWQIRSGRSWSHITQKNEKKKSINI